MLATLVTIVHVFVCAVLMFVVLLQQGKGGGLGAAFGGGAAAQVFGGRGAGNLLTRATAICAAIFMLTSVSLAAIASGGDRGLKAKSAQASQVTQLKTKPKAEQKPAEEKPAETGSTSPASGQTSGTGGGAPKPAEPAPSK